MKRLGAFYREKILSLPKKELVKREMPYRSLENMEIVRDLFGVKIYYTILGRKSRAFIECRSEEEARFLRIFNDAGMSEIYVPRDDDYLKSILPELEKLKERTDEIINSNLEYVLSRSMRERLRREVYNELMK